MAYYDYGQTLICFFPYVEIAEPKTIRDIFLFPVAAADQLGISDEDQEHIRKLSGLFYRLNNKPISNLTCAILPASETSRRRSQFFKHLEEIRILLGYLCCLPDNRPEIFSLYYNYEQVDYYLFEPSPIRIQKKFLYCIRFEEADGEEGEFIDESYEYSLNQGDRWNIAEGCRIYPQSRVVSRAFNIDDHLYSFQRITSNVNALDLFYLDQIDTEKEERVFNAFEWYNRSCSYNISGDVALVSLAVAFETLLGLRKEGDTHRQTSRVSKVNELLSPLQLLLGEVPRLSEWLDQFYDARSRILHEGEWSQLRFSVSLEDSKLESPRSEYGYLIHYGWLVFRICVNSYLAGPLQVARTDLKSRFFHNQERLERIQKVLRDTKDPYEALYEVVGDIKALYRYPSTHFRAVKLKTIFDVGISLVGKLLEIGDELDGSQIDSLNKIASVVTDAPNPDEINEIIQHTILLLETTSELPLDKVRQPAINQLRAETPPTLDEIERHIQKILNDNRNKNISNNLRIRLKNIIELIEGTKYRPKLQPFTILATHGEYITKRRLFTLIEGYSSYVEEIIRENKNNSALYIVNTKYSLSQQNP